MSQSEYRLHPIALLLLVGKQLREMAFAVVALIVVTRTGSDSSSAMGQAYGLIGGVLIVLGPSLAKLLTFRYRYGDEELVIRWGWLFRKVRHIPFARIQSLDARELLPHRWTDTVAVKVETGGGAEADGDIAAIPRAAFEAMRQRILLQRGDDLVPGAETAPQSEDSLAHLSTTELMLAGLINNRGMIVVAGIAAIVFEWGFGNRLLEGLFGPAVAEQGTFRTVIQLLQGSIALTPQVLLVSVLALVAFLMVVRVMSLLFTVLRFHDHHLVKIGTDLRVSCGLLTRATSTTPLRRIQTLTIREGPWHRLAGRVTVLAATAGGSVLAETVASRETLAPLLLRSRVPVLIQVALSGINLPETGWQGAAPPSRRRAVVRMGVVWVIPLAVAWFTGPPAVVVMALCAGWALVAALGRVAQFGWIAFDGGVALRSGWIWRRTTIVRHDRIQLAILLQSPFDRRHNMAEVSVDTAGSSAPTLNFPWLTREDAARLVARLNAGIVTTEFTT